jgi:3-oxoacyl-[acyl-carrier protein] reductase
VPLPLQIAAIGDNHKGGADDNIDGHRAFDNRRIAIDGSGLPDVERFSLCDAARFVDERDVRQHIGRCELSRQRTAQIAGADDDCRRHADYSICMDRVCLVTGGTRGIGFAIAQMLIAHGNRVAITGTSDAGTQSAEQQLGAGGGAEQVTGITCDVRDPAAVERAVRHVVDRFGQLDVLVNNAGVGVGGTIADMTYDEWNRIIGTNLTGVFHCCKAAIPHLRARGGGWIINVSSLASKNPFPGAGAYCASKTALNALSEVLMQELRYDNIRVSYVLPGSVATEFSGRSAGQGSDWKLHAEDVARAVVGLFEFPAGSLPSRIEIRPARPARPGTHSN